MDSADEVLATARLVSPEIELGSKEEAQQQMSTHRCISIVSPVPVVALGYPFSILQIGTSTRATLLPTDSAASISEDDNRAS